MLPDLKKEGRPYIHYDFLTQSRLQEPISFSANSRLCKQRFMLQVTVPGSNVSKHMLVPPVLLKGLSPEVRYQFTYIFSKMVNT